MELPPSAPQNDPEDQENSQEQKPPNKWKINEGKYTVELAGVLILLGIITAWFGYVKLTSFPVSQSSSSSSVTSSIPAVENSLKLYWLTTEGKTMSFTATPFKTDPLATPVASLKLAIKTLIEGVDDLKYTSAIPKNTYILSLSIKDNEIFLDLSESFTEGGGSDAMVGRLGQIIYTVSSFKPGGKLWLSVEGKPLETLGGEGVMITQPLTKEQFNQDFLSNQN